MKKILLLLIILTFSGVNFGYSQNGEYKKLISLAYNNNSEAINLKFKYDFSDKDNNKYETTIWNSKYSIYKLDIKKNGEEIKDLDTTDLIFTNVTEYGTIELGEDKHTCIFVLSNDGGTGGYENILNLINLKFNDIIYLSVDFSYDANYLPYVDTSDNFNFPEYKAEKDFL